MKLTRLLTLGVVVLLFVAVPSQALCIKCISSECWAGQASGRSNCYSYGTSCLLSGTQCGSGSGLDCGADVGEWCEQGALEPLALEYELAEVRIRQPKAETARVADATVERTHTETLR